jgi:hypothetical protein
MKRLQILATLAFISAMLSSWSCGSAAAQEPASPAVDMRGAVLCDWSIAVTQRAIGNLCFKGRDKDYLASLDWAISRMDTFIVQNSGTTLEQLQENKRKMEEELLRNTERDSKGICTPGQSIFAFYPEPSKMPKRQEIELWIERLLAVPRPPVMNPCL